MRQIAYGQDALFEFPLLTPATSDFMTAFPVVIAAGDVKVSTDTALDANPGAYILSFDSMDALPSRGDAITENGGDGAATVMFVIIVSGTVAGGTAAGFMFVKGVSGTWTDNATIDNTTTSDTDFGTVDTGVQVWTTNAAATAGLFAWANNKCYVALTAAETACGQGTVLVKDATATELWIDTGEAFTTVREDDGIVCRGYFKSDSTTTAFTLQRILQGALTNVQVGDILKPVGLPARAIKTFNSGTGAGTTDAFVSTPASLAFMVFGSAPLDATADFSTTQKTSLDTAADSVILANGAHGGAAATLTLLSGVINNSAGVGLAISGTTIGLDVNASAGPGVDIDGTTFGLTADASAGPGAALSGTTIGLDINASAGIGVDVDGTTGGITSTASAGVGMTVTGSTTALGIHGASTGIDLDASAGIGVDLDGTTFGMCIDGSAGPGLSISGTTMGLDLNASAGPAADIDGTTYGLDINASAGDGVQIVGTTADIDSDITGAASGNCTTGEAAAILAKCLVGVKKNTALANFPFVMRDSSTHLPKTGLTVSGYRSLDGAAYAATATASATEVSNGSYKLSLAAADLNATTVILRFTATGADDLFVTVLTEV